MCGNIWTLSISNIDKNTSKQITEKIDQGDLSIKTWVG